MKICQINCVYGEGSTGKITRDIHLYLQKKGINSIVLVPMTSHLDKGVFQFSNKTLSYCSAAYRRGFGRQFDGAQLQTSRILNILKKEKPDIVHLQCINGNNINIYRLLNYLSDNRIKTVLTLHAEYPYTGGCGHAYDCEKWKSGCGACPILKSATQSVFFDGTKHTWSSQFNSYNRFHDNDLIVTAVSPWLMSRAVQSPMLKRFKKSVILNGCDTKIFHIQRTGYWREKLQIRENQKLIAHVTASFNPSIESLKGSNYVCQIAESLDPREYMIVVAANYWKTGSLPKNVIVVGRTETQDELAKLYSEADFTLLTSKRETFSMVTAESLCCGTPVIGFKAGGPESIALDDYSFFTEHANCEAIITYIKDEENLKYNRSIISEIAQNSYSVEKMTESYYHIYKRIKEER